MTTGLPSLAVTHVSSAGGTLVAAAIDVVTAAVAGHKSAEVAMNQTHRHHVQLCFADGSCVSLPDTASAATALRAAAAALVGEPPL
jgi:hypothetical protein